MRSVRSTNGALSTGPRRNWPANVCSISTRSGSSFWVMMARDRRSNIALPRFSSLMSLRSGWSFSRPLNSSAAMCVKVQTVSFGSRWIALRTATTPPETIANTISSSGTRPGGKSSMASQSRRNTRNLQRMIREVYGKTDAKRREPARPPDPPKTPSRHARHWRIPSVLRKRDDRPRRPSCVAFASFVRHRFAGPHPPCVSDRAVRRRGRQRARRLGEPCARAWQTCTGNCPAA